MKVKPIGEIVEKFGRRASAATDDYRHGVETTEKDWAGLTAAAEPTYEVGVTDAMARKSFGKGVKKAGTPKWRAGASGKGADRYAPGVRGALDAYQRGVAPYLEELSRLNLRPRGPRGSDSNYQRSKDVGQALHKKRVGS